MKKIYVGGTIVTMAVEGQTAEAMLIDNDKIAAVGTESEVIQLIDSDTEVVNLQGQYVYPGFIDPHSHFAMQCMVSNLTNISSPPVGDITSIEQMVVKLKSELEAKVEKPKFFMAMGYDHELLAEKRHPNREDLDKVSQSVPVIVMHASGHVGALNSKALEFVGYDQTTPDPEGGKIERYPNSMVPTGYLEERAIQECLPRSIDPNPELLAKLLVGGQLLYAKAGVTTVQDGFTGNDEFGLYKMGAENGVIDLDIHCYPPAIKGLRSDSKWVTGEFGIKPGDKFGNQFGNVSYSGHKIVLDGSPQARTAWMTKPYQQVRETDPIDHVAYPFYEDDEEVIEGLTYAIGTGQPVLVHCNGDAAADQYIRCLKVAYKRTGIKPGQLNNVMIHCQTTREDQLDEMKELGIIPAMFPIHTYFWGDIHYRNFGPERANKISNQKYALSIGLLPTSHEDCPVLPPNPLMSVWSACNRVTRTGRVLGEGISRYQALRTVTYNAAVQYGEEAIKGTIESGKQSDFIISKVDLINCSNDQLFNAKIEQTIKRGKVIYSRN